MFVHADPLLQEHPSARAKVCATGCTTFSSKDDGGSSGQQLVIENADETTPIGLVATVDIPHQRPVRSTLEVRLAKSPTSGASGSYVSYETDVHLDPTGRLEEGPA